MKPTSPSMFRFLLPGTMVPILRFYGKRTTRHGSLGIGWASDDYVRMVLVITCSNGAPSLLTVRSRVLPLAASRFIYALEHVCIYIHIVTPDVDNSSSIWNPPVQADSVWGTWFPDSYCITSVLIMHILCNISADADFTSFLFAILPDYGSFSCSR